MKKDKAPDSGELRAAYKRGNFPGGFVRGTYAQRLRESSNIVVLKPEVAKAFPNEEAVNTALLSLIDLVEKTKHLAKRGTGASSQRAARSPYMLGEKNRDSAPGERAAWAGATPNASPGFQRHHRPLLGKDSSRKAEIEEGNPLLYSAFGIARS
jgi:hypothetical protein